MLKRGNSRGAKGPYCCHALESEGESRLSGKTTTEQENSILSPAFQKNSLGLPEPLFRLRKKLYIKAKREPGFRFYALYDRIYRQDVLAAAWTLVVRNGGAPGVDGVSIRQIQTSSGGEQAFLDELRISLQEKRYKPQAVRRVMIPKANGGERPLGIPTIRDRVVQTAAKLILEPIFEADFLDSSYGFRPQKSAHDALTAIKTALEQGYTAVYDADLKGYFDTIPHDKLMACVEMRVSDRSVLRLIRLWLKAPVQESSKDDQHPPGNVRKKHGTPQGGVISPLLANLYLHWLDKRFHAEDGPAQFAGAHIIRYADDFVILARFIGPGIRSWIECIVEQWMGLTLNQEKTSIRHLGNNGDSLDFLGYSFRYKRSRYKAEEYYLSIEPSTKACSCERDSIRRLLNSHSAFVPISELIARVNRQTTGWKNYFDHFHHGMQFQRMNYFLCHRMVKHLKRRSQRPVRPPDGMRWYEFIYGHLGLIRL